MQAAIANALFIQHLFQNGNGVRGTSNYAAGWLIDSGHGQTACQEGLYLFFGEGE